MSVDKNHWAHCVSECESQGGLIAAGFNLSLQVCCECEDGSILDYGRFTFDHYPPEKYEIYDNNREYDFQ